MMTTPKHWATREQALHWLPEARAIVANEQDDPKTFEEWPIHKIAAYVYQGAGPEALKVVLEECTFRPDQLRDNAAELDRRRLPEVAAVLRELAEAAPPDGE